MSILAKYYLPALISFLCGIVIIPFLVKIAKKRKIMDNPNSRKVNKNAVPTLGGIAIYIGFVLSTLIFNTIVKPLDLLGIILGITIIIGLGIFDDLKNLSARTKLLFISLALLTVIIFSGLSFCNFHNFMGIRECPYPSGIIITLFAGIVIINGFNLIDGIDGLASGLALQISFVLGTWFALVGLHNFAVMAFSLSGGCFAFFFYNVFGKKNKIFMGDTGSLLIGIIVFILATKFNQFTAGYTGDYAIKSAPAVLIGILAYPLFDVLRVFALRIIVLKKSPFKPDKNHLHHRLLAFGMNHLQATLTILAVNQLFIAGAFVLQKYLGVFELTCVILSATIILSLILEMVILCTKKIKPNDKYQHLFLPGFLVSHVNNKASIFQANKTSTKN